MEGGREGQLQTFVIFGPENSTCFDWLRAGKEEDGICEC